MASDTEAELAPGKSVWDEIDIPSVREYEKLSHEIISRGGAKLDVRYDALAAKTIDGLGDKRLAGSTRDEDALMAAYTAMEEQKEAFLLEAANTARLVLNLIPPEKEVFASKDSFLEALKAAYEQSTSQDVKMHIARLYLSLQPNSVDANSGRGAVAVITSSDLDLAGDRRHILLAIIQVFLDEREGQERMEPVLDAALLILKPLIESGEVPDFFIVFAEDIMYKGRPFGPAGIFIHPQLDEGLPMFLIRSRSSVVLGRPSHPSLENDARKLAFFIVHEITHRKIKKYPEGTFQTAINELLTQYYTLSVIYDAQAGMFGHMEFTDFANRMTDGYEGLVAIANVISEVGNSVGLGRPELASWGRDQDFQAFISHFDEVASSDPQFCQRIIDGLDNEILIGPNQYQELVEILDKDGFITLEQVLSAHHRYAAEVTALYSTRPLNMFHAFLKKFSLQNPDYVISQSDFLNDRSRRHFFLKWLINETRR